MRTTARRSLTLLATAAMSVTLVACGGGSSGSETSPTPMTSASTEAAAFPVTVTAANGQVTIPAKPKAIVSLSSTSTEMLYAIGAGSQVKAVDQYSDYPAQAPKTDLSGLQPNVEAIVAEKPDLVVVQRDSGDLGKRLASFSIPLLAMPSAQKLDDVYAQLDQLGRATGHADEAQAEATQVRDQIDKIVASTTKPEPAASYYWELQPDYYSATSSTFVGQVLGLLNLKSIADASGTDTNAGYPQLSAESIIKANPDYIFLADTVCCQQSSETVAKRPGWSAITAVVKDRVVALNDDIASRWGPRIVDLLQKVADAVSGGAQK